MASYIIRSDNRYYIKFRENGLRKMEYFGSVYNKKTKVGRKLSEVQEMVRLKSQIELNQKNNHSLCDLTIDIQSALDSFRDNEYLVGKQKSILSTQTKKGYIARIEYLRKWFESIKINKFKHLTILHVRKYENDIAHLKESTRHDRQKTMIRFLKWCGKMGYWKLSMQLDDIPRIKKPKTLIKENDIMSIQQLENIFSTANDKFKNAIMIMYYTGCRAADVGFIKWSDYNSNNLSLVFTVNDGSKTKHEDEVMILPIVKDIIERQRNITGDKEYVFCNTKGEMLSSRNLREAFSRVMKKCNIQKSTRYLRHTFATQMLKNGATIEQIKSLLRHSNIQTTQVYAHFTKSMQKQALHCLPIINTKND